MDRFRRIERAAERKGLDLAWYKPLDLDDLKAAIESWHWEGTIREVAGTS